MIAMLKTRHHSVPYLQREMVTDDALSYISLWGLPSYSPIYSMLCLLNN